MRRWLSGGVLLSLGLFAGHAAVEAWMEARAVFALEEAARRLPEGARLAWGRLDARPLRLALEIDGVRLDLPDHAGVRSLEVGTLRLAQAGGGVESLGRVAAVRAENVAVELAQGGGTVRIGAVEGAQVDIDALTAVLARPEPWRALAELRLGPLALEELELVDGDASVRVPRLSLGGWADRGLETLVLERLEARDGTGGGLKLATLAIDRLDLEAADPDTLDRLGEDPMAFLALVDRLRIDGFRLAELSAGDGADRLDLARFELGRLGQGRLDGFRLERLEIEGAEGRGDLALAEIERADWSRVRLERLVRAGTLLGELAAELDQPADEAAEGDGEEAADESAEASGTDPAASDDTMPSEEEKQLAASFAGLELAAELARLEIGTVRIERLAAGERGGAGVELERLRWDGIADRRVGAIELAGLLFRGEDAVQVGLARFEQSPVTIAPPDFAERLERAPRTAEALQELTTELARLPWDSRTLLAGFGLDKAGRRGFGIERAALTLAQQGTTKTTRFELDGLVLDPAVMEEEQLRGTLAAAGIDRLQLAARLVSSFDEASLDAALDPFALDAPSFLAVRTSLFGKLGADPAVDPVTASADSVLVRAEIRLEDKGLIDRQLEAMAQEAGKKRADLVEELLRDLRSEEPMRSLLDRKRAAELQKFLNAPRVLVIRLAPTKPVSFMAAFMGLLATPGQTAKTLGLTIEARDS
jgi:hypothetical protein